MLDVGELEGFIEGFEVEGDVVGTSEGFVVVGDSDGELVGLGVGSFDG